MLTMSDLGITPAEFSHYVEMNRKIDNYVNEKIQQLHDRALLINEQGNSPCVKSCVYVDGYNVDNSLNELTIYWKSYYAYSTDEEMIGYFTVEVKTFLDPVLFLNWASARKDALVIHSLRNNLADEIAKLNANETLLKRNNSQLLNEIERNKLAIEEMQKTIKSALEAFDQNHGVAKP